MAEERWRPVPGFALHEESDRGRVRTTADGPGSPVVSLVWLLALAVVAVLLWKAHLVTTVANTVALALCSAPVGWIGFQLCAEAKFAWTCRRYSAPVRPARLAPPRAPSAIEAARPVSPLAIEQDGMRMDR